MKVSICSINGLRNKAATNQLNDVIILTGGKDGLSIQKEFKLDTVGLNDISRANVNWEAKEIDKYRIIPKVQSLLCPQAALPFKFLLGTHVGTLKIIT